ncbi:uncharacterized protein PAF06_012453 [Gastrophryne carolinensis]
MYARANKPDTPLANKLRYSGLKQSPIMLRSTEWSNTANPVKIVDIFKRMLGKLYVAPQVFPRERATKFLDSISFPEVTETHRANLEAEISVPEVLKTIKSFKASKALGPDGFSNLYYKKYAAELAPHLARMFNSLKEKSTLNQTSLEAFISMILKPDKDHLNPQNYRPISLLNVDLKILGKVLVSRINEFLGTLIEKDQVGFVPNRQDSDNIRRVAYLIKLAQQREIHSLLLSLDMQNAFDSLSWDYVPCPSEMGIWKPLSNMDTVHLLVSISKSSVHEDSSSKLSRLSLLHECVRKIGNHVQQYLLVAVAVLFMMWQHFKTLLSLWCRMPYQEHFKNGRNMSVNAEVDLLAYCFKKWRGEALNVTQMRKAYEDCYCNHHIRALRIVKPDNYSVFRAVMSQVFSQGVPFPGWMKEKDILKLPEKLLYSQGCNWIQQFSFGPEKYTGLKVYAKLRSCLEVFKNQWSEFYNCKDKVERNRMFKVVFSDNATEHKLYEALKFIMLYLVIEAYENLKTEQLVQSFFHLLFSRDTSADPLSYMMNHLNSVGDTTGLEQGEICIIGYALEVKIKIFRLPKINTEDFEMFYPEDYKREWHEISLMTDDDQHYNIPLAAK